MPSTRAIEAKIVEKLGGIALGIQEQLEVAAFGLMIHKMCNHLVQKSFTLMAGIYRHAAQRVLEAGTGRRKVIIFVEETNAVIQVLVQLDSFFLQQGFLQASVSLVRGTNLTQCIFTHVFIFSFLIIYCLDTPHA